ncbi:hypothetical protein Pmar_PMAR016267, partial [Perkinsus marinus ATCC 50983]
VQTVCGHDALEANRRFPCRTFFGFPTDYPKYLLIASNRCLSNMIVSSSDMEQLYEDMTRIIEARHAMMVVV